MERFKVGIIGAGHIARKMAHTLRDMEGVEPYAVASRNQENAEGFLNAFLAKKPDVPVVLFSRVLFAMDRYDEYRIKLRKYYKNYLCGLAEKYRKKGYKVYFADGSKIFKGNYTEYTADGIHPSDMGMVAIAGTYEREVKKALKRIKI